MYGVIFKVVNPAGDVIFGDESTVRACFRDYTYTYSSKVVFDKTNTLYIYLPKSFKKAESKSGYYSSTCSETLTDLNEDQIFYYFEQLDKAGLKNRLFSEKDRYVIKVEEADYINLSHYRIALDFFRLLWEDSLNQVLPLYFKLPSEIRDNVDFFEGVQAFFLYQYFGKQVGTNGHTLPCYNGVHGYSLGSVLSMEEIVKFLKENPNHKDGSYQVYISINNLKQNIKVNDSNPFYPILHAEASVNKSLLEKQLQKINLNSMEDWNKLLSIVTVKPPNKKVKK